MKTAMEELMDKVQSINERYDLKGDSVWLMNEIIDLIENSFEKEKEQIEETFDNGFYHAFYCRADETQLDGENYYNEKYNLKK